MRFKRSRARSNAGTGLWWSRQLVFVVLLASTFAAIADDGESSLHELEYCAYGESTSATMPFSAIAHVTLRLQAPALSESLLRAIAQSLIRARVWPNSVDRVSVEPYDAEVCGTDLAPAASITADISKEALAAIEPEVVRGDGDSIFARVSELAKLAKSTLTASPSPSHDAVTVRVFYATNRKASGTRDVATAYTADHDSRLSYGAVEVAVEADPRMSTHRGLSIVRFSGATDLSNFSVNALLTPMSLQDWKREVQQRAMQFGTPGVLVFVHGYNVPFANAARRAAQLSYDLGFAGPTVFFAWPSDATPNGYAHDWREAELSGTDVGAALTQIGDMVSQGRAPIYLIAHSLGNRVAMGGLQGLAAQRPDTAHEIKEVVFAAPDVDQELFRIRISSDILDLGPRYTLYASDHDLALLTSEWLQGGKRLGRGGSALYLATGLDSIDATAVTGQLFSLNHSYFGDSSSVLSDLFYLIRYGNGPAQRPHLKRIEGDRGGWALIP